jgi:hypothetical protein
MGHLLFFFSLSAWDTGEIVARLCISCLTKGATFAFLSRAWRFYISQWMAFSGLKVIQKQ